MRSLRLFCLMGMEGLANSTSGADAHFQGQAREWCLPDHVYQRVELSCPSLLYTNVLPASVRIFTGEGWRNAASNHINAE
jgi:hypothetical protein